MNISFLDKQLNGVAEKVFSGQRLDFEDGMIIYNSPDLIGIGRLADVVRRKRHGAAAFYVYNQHINYTNVCINRCAFCAYGKDDGDRGSFTLSVDDIAGRIEERMDEPIREYHIVGGLNPALPFEYYLNLLRTIRKMRPNAAIKAFTAVEIDYLSRVSGLSLDNTIGRLKDAGLDMLPGGGAEVMSDRVRKRLFPKKIDATRWLNVMEAVHRSGLTSNATMLYGHIETHRERVEHLLRLRDLQDQTGGFSAFIPLAFHSENTKLSHIPATTAYEDVKTVAVARLILDNFEHIKAYWVMIGLKLAQVALSFGADDLDGTIIHERITHMAGATSPKGLTAKQMEHLIRSAGFEPVQRDSYYCPVRSHKNQGSDNHKQAGQSTRKAVSQIIENVPEKRIDFQKALSLYHDTDLLSLGKLAGSVRQRLHPEPIVTFVIDRNINYTNVCVSGCRFCAFYRPPGDPDGYIISRDELGKKIEETLAVGGTQILLQGGMNPDFRIDDYEALLSYIKTGFNIHIHGFSPPEIYHLSQISGLPIDDVIRRLKNAGLGSIPGGGAEILVDEIRSRLSPNKCTAGQWLDVMRAAHRIGLKSTATMMFGHIESPEDIITHLFKIRELQDETGGFTAFIPWTFQPGNTDLNVSTATSAEYLRVLALSRIVLDNIPNIQASWVTQADKIAQTALAFGANDLGSTMIEENVVAAAGVKFRLPKSEMVRLIRDAGYRAVQRDCFYNHLHTVNYDSGFEAAVA